MRDSKSNTSIWPMIHGHGRVGNNEARAVVTPLR
jgi:tetrahydromethanopterin S-methyltransferase subunit A